MENEEIVRNYQNRHLLSTPLYTDLAGGLNTRVSPPQMGISQSQVARNVIYNVASGAVSSRDGTVRYVMAPVPLAPSSGLYGFTQAKFSKGFRFLVWGGSSGTFEVHECAHPSPGTWQTLTDAALTSVPPSRRVGHCFYNDVELFCNGADEPFGVKFDGAAPELVQMITVGAPAYIKAAEFIVVYNNKVYCAGSQNSQLAWSAELGAGAVLGTIPEFPSENVINPGGVSDGDSIMGLAVAYGHLIIFKRNAIYALSESSGVPSITQIGRSIGLVCKHAYCNAENSVWFFGPGGAYSIGSDLTPQFESDFVLPDYQDMSKDLQIDFESYAAVDLPSVNHPVFAYNRSTQQVWVSGYVGDMTNPKRNIVYIHDMINKDASGRAAVSNYVFYQSAIRNYTPVLFCEAIDETTNEPLLLSMSRKVEAADATLNDGVANPYYVYRHDVPCEDGSLGDDGNSVEFMWESKYLNLGDPLRLKALRYYTIFGDPRDEISTTVTNQNYSYSVAGQVNAKNTVLPVAAKGVASVLVGDYIYCFGGIDTSGNYLNTIYRYEISTDTWALLPSTLAVGRAYAEAIYDGSTYVYLFGGATSVATATNTVQRAILAQLTPLIAGNFSILGVNNSLLRTRAMFGCALDSSNQKVYCFGGITTALDNTAIFESYNLGTITAAALQPPSLAGCTAGGALAFYSNFVFMFLGTLVQRYNIAAGTWLTSVATGRANLVGSSAVVSGTEIYLLGGSGYDATPAAGASVATVDMYTPSVATPFVGDTWTARAPIASPRSLFAGGIDSNSLAYVIGGTGFPISAYFSTTDDFKNYFSVDVDIILNSRQVVPATLAFLGRYWSLTFKGRITEGIARVIGFCLDYHMFQRRG